MGGKMKSRSTLDESGMGIQLFVSSFREDPWQRARRALHHRFRFHLLFIS
jgi:hypothetical protein